MYQRRKDGSGLDSDNSRVCRYNGLKSQGVKSLNSVLQVLFLNKDFREAVERYCTKNPNTEYIDAQLNKVFDDLKKYPGDPQAVKRKLPVGVYYERHAAWCLENILNLTSPEASQMFRGQLRHRITCGTCHHHTDEVSEFLNLSLDVMDTEVYNVMDGVESLFRCTKLNGQMYCDQCHVKGDATTQTGIADHPENLTLQLNRFEYDNQKQYDQIKPVVWVPPTLQIEDQTYELHAVVEQHAGLTGGDFSATIKTQDDGRWYKFKDKLVDSVVDSQPFPSVMENSPHLLIYQKQKSHGTDNTVHDVNLKSSEDCNDICREMDRNAPEDVQNMKGWKKEEKKVASKQTTAKCPPETNSSKTGSPANSGDSPAPKYYGLERQAATCSLNSALQILFMNKDFREAVGRACSINPKTRNTDAQLNKLFDDLKKDTADSYALKMNLGGAEYIERNAAKYLEKILNMTSPEASQMFRGQLRRRTTCGTCHHHIDKVDPFWNLPLVMDTQRPTEVYSVLSGIESFFKRPKLRGHNQMYCHQCHVRGDATTQTEIMDHPEILTLLLKRSEYEDFLYRFNQINHSVDAPLALQIAADQTYELHAVVEHYGGVGSEGYTATIKSQDDGRWYKFQDRTVTLVDSQPFRAFTINSPHLLIYRKEKTHGSDTSVHEVNLKSSSQDRSSICRERNRNAPEEGNDNDGLYSTERHNGPENKYTADRAVSSDPYQEERVPQRIGSHLSGQSFLCKSQDSQNRVSKREPIQDHGQREHESAGSHRQSCLDVKGNIGVKGNVGTNKGTDKHLQITKGCKDGGDTKKDASKQTTAKSNSPLEAHSSQTAHKYYGLEYQGRNSSLNSVLQVLFMNKDFRETVKRCCSENTNTKNCDAQLNKVFRALKKHNTSSYDMKWQLGFTLFEGRNAAENLEKILKMTSPEASQMFRGQLRHMTTCCRPTCLPQTDEVSPFWHLSLVMDTDSEVYSVVDGIESLGKTKTSGHKDCHCGGKAETQTGIMDYPEILTLQLNQFEYDHVNRSVDVPLNLQIENQTYELHTVVDHHGVPGYGYWTATIKSQDDGRWYKFEDTLVTLMHPQPFQTLTERSRSAYLLMYKKEKKHIPDQDSGQRAHEKAGEVCQTLQLDDKRIRQQSVSRHEDNKVARADNFLEKDANIDKHRKGGGDGHVHTAWGGNREKGQEEESYGGGQAGMAGKGGQKDLRDGGQAKPHDSQTHGGVNGQESPYGSQKQGGQEIPFDSKTHGGVKGRPTVQKAGTGGQKEHKELGDGGQERPHDRRDSQNHGPQERHYVSQTHGGQERPYDSQYHGGVKGDGGQKTQYDSQNHGGVKGQERPYGSQKQGEQEIPFDSQTHEGVKGTVQKEACDGKKDGSRISRYIKSTISYFSHPACRYNGLRNQGSTCYLNSVLQILFMTKDFREAVERHCRENPKSENIDAQLNGLFERLKTDVSSTCKVTQKMEIKEVYVQRDAAEYLEKILNMTSPEASKMFRGQLRHRTTCCTCQHQTDVVNPFWNLHLAMDTDSKVYNVMDGFMQFFRPAHFSGDNQMYCENCDDKEDATLDCEINHKPEILTLLLKRFEFDFHLMDYIKINRSVDVPTMLNISEKQTYELYGVVNHGGSLKGGHYTATIKSQDDGRWYNFNDSSVTEVYPQPFQGSMQKSSSAYVLFYRKKKGDTPSLQGLEVSREKIEKNELGNVTREGDYRAGAASTRDSVKKKIMADGIGGIVKSLNKLTTHDDHHKGQDSQERFSHGGPKDRGQRAHQNIGYDQKLQRDDKMGSQGGHQSSGQRVQKTPNNAQHAYQNNTSCDYVERVDVVGKDKERTLMDGKREINGGKDEQEDKSFDYRQTAMRERSGQGEREDVGDDGQKRCDEHNYKAVEVREGNVEHDSDALVEAKPTQETRAALDPARMLDHSEQMGSCVSEQDIRNVSEKSSTAKFEWENPNSKSDNTALKRDPCKRTSESLAEVSEESMANNSVRKKQKGTD